MVGLMWATIGRMKENAGLFGANSSIASNELEGLNGGMHLMRFHLRKSYKRHGLGAD